MLTSTKLVFRNLAYHAQGNFAVLLGVAVGSAVLTGALLVGDSLRASLRARAERQLAGVDAVAFLPRPVRAGLADGLPGQVAPVLMLPGSLQASGDPVTAPYIGRVTVLGVDDRFKPAGVSGVDWASNEKKVVLSERVAAKLGAKPGDRVRIGVEKFSDLPRSSSLAKRDVSDVTGTEELEVAAVLPADAPEGDFNLTPNPAAPLNVFMPVRALARLATGDAVPLATALLARGASANELDAAIRPKLRAADFGLKLREVERRFGAGGYVSVESTELILPPKKGRAVEGAARELGLGAEPTVVYVADTLAKEEPAGESKPGEPVPAHVWSKQIPYPIIAGLNPGAAPPLGPFLPKGVSELADNEVILLDWPGSELNNLPAGTRLLMLYFDPEVEGEGKMKSAALTLRGYVPLSGAARDRNLTPAIKGVTDARANLFDWDRPPVLPKETIRRRVPDKHPRSQFFNTNKATPMAYLNLATARTLFKSRYGADTSVRVAPAPGESLEATTKRLHDVLPNYLTGGEANEFRFDPVRERLLAASRGGTDFGGLFLGFSCFLIAAALMLVGLLFRLSLDRRAKEVGLLLAAGFSVRQMRRLLLAEGLLVAVVGAGVGLAAGVAYNRLLLAVLLELWPDPEVRNYLKPHAAVLSFALGFGLTVLMALVALWWSVRGLVKVPPPALLRGETAGAADAVKPPARWVKVLAVASLVIGVALVAAGGSIDNPDFRAMTFFSGGGLLLTAALAGASIWMRRTRHATVDGRGAPALAQLGSRNAARNPGRSLLTASLIAAASFLLVAVESFRRQPGQEFLEKHGGSGGYNLIAALSSPLHESFATGRGRADLEAQLRKAYAPKDPDAPQETPAFQKAKAELNAIEEVLPLRVRGGDDASCANLYQVTRPRVLGVPQSLMKSGRRFKFYETLAKNDAEKANPWRLLGNTYHVGSDLVHAVPVFCEQNTAQWMLKKGVGDTLTMPDDRGEKVTFIIVGTLIDSPFQSELITSDEEFVNAFPSEGGYREFLVRTAPGQEEAVARVLQVGFRANGLTATPTRERIASYQAVIGAYLSTFQLLGGLGLLLGVLGLAAVILRGVWERLGELALLRAVGYRTRALQFLVLVENALLLLLGLAAGVLAALVSVAPHVASGAAVPWARLAALLGLVLVVGFVVASAATAGILRVPVIPALRRE